MHIYCKTCKNIQVIHFQNLISKNKIKVKSKWVICLTEITFIDESEGDLESELEIYLQFLTDWYYKHKGLLC